MTWIKVHSETRALQPPVVNRPMRAVQALLGGKPGRLSHCDREEQEQAASDRQAFVFRGARCSR